MNRLHQNITIFLHVFSINNPNGIWASNNKTCRLFIGVLISLLVFPIIYIFLIGVGLLTSYILTNQSYNVLSGCPISDQNCTVSQLFCNGGSTVPLLLACFVSGSLSVLILLIAVILVTLISYCILSGISTIANETYKSFKNTKENIAIPVISEKIICDIELGDVELNIIS